MFSIRAADGSATFASLRTATRSLSWIIPPSGTIGDGLRRGSFRKVQTLSEEWESEHGLAWRPDGKEIWFTATKKGINLNLMAVDLSGKVRTLLNLPVGLTLQDIASDGRVSGHLELQTTGDGFHHPRQQGG